MHEFSGAAVLNDSPTLQDIPAMSNFKSFLHHLFDQYNGDPGVIYSRNNLGTEQGLRLLSNCIFDEGKENFKAYRKHFVVVLKNWFKIMEINIRGFCAGALT